jgi:putative membrane-bound dehydrogenase-like protein
MTRNGILRLVGAASVSVAIGAASAAEFKLLHHTFSLPDGFEIEQVAGPPLANRPIVADFDEQGRLYVADSGGSNDPVQQQLEKKPHRIVRLEDTDGDGRFDRSTVFADRMMFPEGILWFDGAVYCGAPPTIWKLEDTDGDGVADKRTEWHQGKTLTGCANDLHGPYLGPDGWIYWCKGAFAEQTYPRPRGRSGKDSAAHIYRCRPDGSEFDAVMSGGMDNPVEVVFTPEGETIFTTTFYSHPESGKRDGLVHAIYGGVYPKVHGVLDGLKRTGEVMPALVHLGPSASSGLCRYASRGLGQEFEGNLFSTLFNLRKVMRHELSPEGATFRTRDTDFLVSDHHDFHPTDVLEDADGSLIVIDTGGWYKLCCPTSQIAKPDVLGAIYRIRRKGMPKVNDPRGLQLAWATLPTADLIQLLDDARPAVRQRAMHQLAKRGESIVPDLAAAAKGNVSVEARRNTLWALSRIGTPAACEAVLPGLSDAEASVRQVAAHVAGIHRIEKAVGRLAELVVSGEPHLRRAAATSLGQIGKAEAVPALLTGLRQPVDRILEHALIYALIDIGHAGPLLEVARGGPSEQPASLVRGTLIALDQMDHSPLTADLVLPLLRSSNPLLRETGFWITSHRPQWGPEIAGYLRVELAKGQWAEADAEVLRQQLASFGRDEVVQKLISKVVSQRTTPATARLLALQAMTRAKLGKMPAVWVEPLKQCLADPDQALQREAVAAVRALPVGRRPVLRRADAQVNFAEATGPFAGTSLAEKFAVRWTGFIDVPKAGPYTLYLTSDDGSRLFLDDQLVVDNGGSHAMREKSGERELSAGPHSVRLEYFQGGGSAGCILAWSSGDRAKEVVPATALFHRPAGKESPQAGLLGEYFDLGRDLRDFPNLEYFDFKPELLAVALNPKLDDELRVQALAAISEGLENVEMPLFDFLTTCLDPTKSPLHRLTAATLLSRSKLDARQLDRLIATVKAAGALELPALLGAFGGCEDEALGRKLLASVREAKGLGSLKSDQLRGLFGKFPAPVRADLVPVLQQLEADVAEQKTRLDKLQAGLNGGDRDRGRRVFDSAKTACVTCHQVGYVGGRVGPDLTHIGSIRTERDLLEAILYPSASFVRSYESMLVTTRDGEEYSGVLREESSDSIVMITGADASTRLARADVKDIRPGAVSIMPQGIDQALNAQELADLVTFLKSLR